jgi:hypothetical protein
MSTASSPIQAEDFKPVADALATPVTGDAVPAADPIPTDRYLTAEDVAATKAAEAATGDDKTATTEAAVTDPPGSTVPKVAGAPPEDKWDKILDNARKKARAEVEGEYAWVKDMSRDEIEATRKWISLGNQNALLALDQLVQGMIKSNPAQKDQIDRYFRTTFGVAPADLKAAAVAAAPAVDADPEPEPDIPTDASNGVPVVYSKGRQKEWGAWLRRQTLKEVQGTLDKDLAPIRTERQQREVDSQAADYSNRAVSAISGLPGFELYRAEIAAAYNNIPLTDATRTEGEKLRDAYLTVMSTKMSELSTKATQDAVESVTRRAEAGTVDPSRQSAAAPFDYSKATWEQALRHEFNSAALGR